jgi:hypothetical protein
MIGWAHHSTSAPCALVGDRWGSDAASGTLLDLDDEQPNTLAHLLKVDDANEIDVGAVGTVEDSLASSTRHSKPMR